MRFKFLALMFVLPLAILSAAAQPNGDRPEIPLWTNGAPGFESKKNEKELKKMQSQGEYTFANVHNPSITVFLPPKEKATGAGVVVIPGGGHSSIWIVHEGYNIAEFLNQRGIAAFVLKYRLAREKGSAYKIEEHALQDTQRAIRYVRGKAQEWNVNPARVGVMGFSAGGELTALACSKFDKGNPDAGDPIDKLSCRPDFQVLVYPGPGGFKNQKITKETPPAFMVVASDDNFATALSNQYLTLHKAGVLAELHIYSKGGHGFGVREKNKNSPVGTWPQRLYEWIGDQGFLKK